MKKILPLALFPALLADASAALVTGTTIQNRPGNLTQQGGVTASASSEGYGGVASRAIDGDTNGNWAGSSVTHSDDVTDFSPFLDIDLGSAQGINEITLHNRTDCCSGRLSNFTVLAGNDSTFTASLYSSGNILDEPANPLTLNAGGVNARYVRVRLDGLGDTGETTLSLAEVEILGNAQFNYNNLAIGSTASQSSTLSNPAIPTADKAVDGSLAGAFAAGSTTHTDPNDPSGVVFWETQLAEKSNINEIALFNRADCCPLRLSNFRLSVFDGATEVWGENYFTGFGEGAEQTFSVREDTGAFFATGDRVRVELIGGFNNEGTAPNVLSLREVEIYGSVVPEPSSTAMLGLGGLVLILRRKK